MKPWTSGYSHIEKRVVIRILYYEEVLDFVPIADVLIGKK